MGFWRPVVSRSDLDKEGKDDRTHLCRWLLCKHVKDNSVTGFTSTVVSECEQCENWLLWKLYWMSCETAPGGNGELQYITEQTPHFFAWVRDVTDLRHCLILLTGEPATFECCGCRALLLLPLRRRARE